MERAIFDYQLLDDLRMHLGFIEEKRKALHNLNINQRKVIKVFDEETKTFIDRRSEDYIRGIVYANDNYVEFGWFKISPKNIIVRLNSDLIEGDTYIGISREALPNLMWSNKIGCYIEGSKLSPLAKLSNKFIKGQGSFPYQFPKRYEAAENFYLFKDTQEVLNNVKYPLSKYLKYTFGLEFETSMGYIPQEICFRDGLIPLRDGSISGIEYSTVVLEGNRGLNLLKQQIDTLKEYTRFNKECALHIHMGGFPVDPICIYALYTLWYCVERYLQRTGCVPRYTFKTSMYKANQKDYCSALTGKAPSFESVYKVITGRNYLGSLYQPHPADIEKKAKWNIKSRYYGLNLVNMVCYKGPKTVEFRFLRPSYNYRKITLWLYILNAVLLTAETLATEWKDTGHCDTKGMFRWIADTKWASLEQLIALTYDEDTCNHICDEIGLLRLAVKAQENNGDSCGRDIDFEEELFT